jgi:CspA family cold shock protein
MASGTIKTIRPEKGFGFIKKSGGGMGASDLFFHRTAVEGLGFDDLREGQMVSFDEGEDPRDPSRRRAINVRPSSGDSDDMPISDEQES